MLVLLLLLLLLLRLLSLWPIAIADVGSTAVAIANGIVPIPLFLFSEYRLSLLMRLLLSL